jgi:hypothetical protein
MTSAARMMMSTKIMIHHRRVLRTMAAFKIPRGGSGYFGHHRNVCVAGP